MIKCLEKDRTRRYETANGLAADPEARVIICGLSWQRYRDLDKAMGDDRPGPRFYYPDGDL